MMSVGGGGGGRAISKQIRSALSHNDQSQPPSSAAPVGCLIMANARPRCGGLSIGGQNGNKKEVPSPPPVARFCSIPLELFCGKCTTSEHPSVIKCHADF